MRSLDPLLPSEKRKIARLRTGIGKWFSSNARNFPWRRNEASDFEKICVEVLLQRTRAETISAFYPGFFARFRNWDDIANCPIDDLEKALQPIGLWRRRAQSLKGLATFAAENHGRFPISDQELTKVPAVGQYVANAIMMFQHGIARPLLDVNMARVLERVVRSRRLADIRHDPWLQQASHFLVKGDNAAVTNWATLDFAAIVCSARAPECNACPFQKSCSHALNAKTSS